MDQQQGSSHLYSSPKNVKVYCSDFFGHALHIIELSLQALGEIRACAVLGRTLSLVIPRATICNIEILLLVSP